MPVLLQVAACLDQTSRNKFYVTFIPYFWRLLQCLRMYRTTKNYLHLVNAGKYTSFLFVVALGWGMRPRVPLKTLH